MTPSRPPLTGFPFLDEPRRRGAVVAMAHRGGALHPDNAGLENTVQAFACAVGLGYRYLETDVHVTRDGAVLAFHDTVLDRVTDRTGAVAELSYGEVADVLVGGREPVPLLSDLVEAFPGVRFNVDVKAAAAAEPLVDLILRMGIHDRVCVGSFDERVLRRFRRSIASRSGRPVATSCGVLSSAGTRFAGPRSAPWLRDTGAVFQVPLHRGRLRFVDARFVARAHAAGRHVHVWTVDDRAEMEHLLDLGVDGLITDRTDVLQELLVERGQWQGAVGTEGSTT